MLTTSNDQLVQYFFSEVWASKIGGKLGLARKTVPMVINGKNDPPFTVPGIPYKETFMDGSTPAMVIGDIESTINFLKDCGNGTWIQQDIYTPTGFRQLQKYEYNWVKLYENTWQLMHKKIYGNGPYNYSFQF